MSFRLMCWPWVAAVHKALANNFKAKLLPLNLQAYQEGFQMARSQANK